jgi:hypothetical protein
VFLVAARWLAWAGISYSMPRCLLRVPGVDQSLFIRPTLRGGFLGSTCV